MSEHGSRGWVVVDEDACNGCALCIEVCPAGCLSLADAANRHGDPFVRFSGEGCRADGLCTYACPVADAIALYTKRPAEYATA